MHLRLVARVQAQAASLRSCIHFCSRFMFRFVFKSRDSHWTGASNKSQAAGSQAPSICCLCLPSAQITSARSTPGFFYVGLGESTPDPHAFKASAVPFQRPQFEVIQNCRFLLTVYKSNRQERARVPRVQTLAHRKCVLSRMGLPRILHSSSLKCLCLAQNPLLHSLKGHIP